MCIDGGEQSRRVEASEMIPEVRFRIPPPAWTIQPALLVQRTMIRTRPCLCNVSWTTCLHGLQGAATQSSTGARCRIGPCKGPPLAPQFPAHVSPPVLHVVASLISTRRGRSRDVCPGSADEQKINSVFSRGSSGAQFAFELRKLTSFAVE